MNDAAAAMPGVAFAGHASTNAPQADDTEIGVYVHWPFCAQKCPYCDFNSHVRPGGWDEAGFLAAYLQEIKHVGSVTGPRAVRSVFFGGGTPSLMQAETVAAIIGAIDQTWGLVSGAEITLEANPGSVEVGRFRGYRQAGVNRVSVGVQALNDDDLRRLGRVHSVSEALNAVEIANRVFDRVSFDLIYAREGQSVAAWQAELAEALAMAAGHLSLYQLTIEPGTPFERWHASGKLTVPDDELAAVFFDLTQDMTAAAGLPAYETSNHARVGEESRHNLIYWRYQPYVGIGPGAHGRMPAAGGDSGRGFGRCAISTEKAPEAWVDLVRANGHGMIEHVVLDADAMADEMALMGLRLSEGLNLDRLAVLTGFTPSDAELDALQAEGLVDVFTSYDPVTRRLARFVQVRPAGRFVLDAIVLRLSQSFTPVSAGLAAGCARMSDGAGA